MLDFKGYNDYLRFVDASFSATVNYEMTVDLTVEYSREAELILRPGFTFLCDDQTMKIRNVRKEDQTKTTLQIHAEHISYSLSDNKDLKVIKKTNVDPCELVKELLAGTGYTVQPFTAPAIPFVHFKPHSVRDALIRIARAIGYRINFREISIEFEPFSALKPSILVVKKGENMLSGLRIETSEEGVEEKSVGVWAPEKRITCGEYVGIEDPSIAVQEVLYITNLSYNPLSYRGHELRYQKMEFEGIVDPDLSDDEDKAKEKYNQDIEPWTGTIQASGFPEDFPTFSVTLDFYVAHDTGFFDAKSNFIVTGRPARGYWHDPHTVYDERGERVLTYENTGNEFFSGQTGIFQVIPQTGKLQTGFPGSGMEGEHYYSLGNYRKSQMVKTPNWTDGTGEDYHPIMKRMPVRPVIATVNITMPQHEKYAEKDIDIRVSGTDVTISFRQAGTVVGGGGCKIWITRNEQEMAEVAKKVKKGDLVVAAWYRQEWGGLE